MQRVCSAMNVYVLLVAASCNMPQRTITSQSAHVPHKDQHIQHLALCRG